MSEPVTALGGAVFDGYARIAEAGPQGMIVLRGKAEVLEVGLAALGLLVPGVRQVARAADKAALWMSPDEVLIWLPRAGVAAALARLDEALGARHHLVADVSDARAVFTLSGRAAREVLAKACPVDFAPGVFGAGQVRRTRAAQVAVAVWLNEDEVFTLVCFRSVARYVFDLLSTLARPGSEVGLFD